MITPEYRELNRQLHKDHNYGSSGHKIAPLVRALAKQLSTNDVLDYGCGKQTLRDALPDMNVVGYDPSVEGLDKSPEPCDLVVCGDVLEHVEPDQLNDVLKDLKRVVKKIGVFIIHTGPAKKFLSDGRNAHLIQKPMGWWISRLERMFEIRMAENGVHGFLVIVGAK